MPRTRFQKITLKELKKIFPEVVLDGDSDHRIGAPKKNPKANDRPPAKAAKSKA